MTLTVHLFSVMLLSMPSLIILTAIVDPVPSDLDIWKFDLKSMINKLCNIVNGNVNSPFSL